MEKTYNKKNKYELYKKLKEHSVYLVEVSFSSGNPVHKSILFTGFNTGSYWEVYMNNYECAEPFEAIYTIKVLEKLTTVK